MDTRGTGATLAQARPNPFHTQTGIRYVLPRAERVEIGIYDVSGRLVRTLVDAVVPAGVHEAVWAGRDESGRRVPPGVFLYRLRAGNTAQTRRLVFLK